jgi:outer membrane murein-binding lipoprotein Lpp
MNKEIKLSNFTFREHFKIHGYLSPEMIEELLEKVDDLEDKVSKLESDVQDENEQAYYWKMKYETLN